MASIGDLIARRPRALIAAMTVVWALALIPASRIEIRFELESLLPTHSPAATAYREFATRFGGLKRVFVILQAADPDTGSDPVQLTDAADRLANALAYSELVQSARAGISTEEIKGFARGFIQRAPLILPDDDWLERVESRLEPDAIHRRAREIRRSVLSPLPNLTDRFSSDDPFGFSVDLDLESSLGIGPSIDPLTLGFLSHDETAALLVIEPAISELDAESGRRLEALIASEAREISRELGLHLTVRAVGGPLYAAHDEALIRSDLVRTLTVASFGCGALIAAVFAGVAIPIASLVAIAMGVTFLAAFLSLAIGSVSAAAIGFSVVLVGLGIDTAIHGGAAFRQQLLKDRPKAEAITASVRYTWRPVLAAASTTAAAFAVLLGSDLPLLRDLGLMVTSGILLIVAATWLIGAPLAVALAGTPGGEGPLWRSLGRAVGAITRFSSKHSTSILIVACLLTAGTMPAALRTDVEADLSGLRPHNHPVIEAEHALVDLFGIQEETTTILVRGADVDECLGTARRIKSRITDQFPGTAVVSPADRLAGPATISSRLEALKDLDADNAVETLRSELLDAGLNPTAFEPGIRAFEELAEGRDPGAEYAADDPQLRVDRDGGTWAAMTVFPRDRSIPVDELPEIVHSVDDGALVASMPLVSADLRRIASRDLQKLSVLSLALVVAVVVISFRGNVALATTALVPVTLGTIWTLGLWRMLGHHLDLVGLAVIPVMIGLGIDDGLHAVHGARDQPLERSLGRSGRAMTLTTLTTCIGFGALGLSHLPSLRAMAVLIPIGVSACLVATLAVLPALAARRWGLR